jgi:hypothetical protein
LWGRAIPITAVACHGRRPHVSGCLLSVYVSRRHISHILHGCDPICAKLRAAARRLFDALVPATTTRHQNCSARPKTDAPPPPVSARHEGPERDRRKTTGGQSRPRRTTAVRAEVCSASVYSGAYGVSPLSYHVSTGERSLEYLLIYLFSVSRVDYLFIGMAWY